MERVLAGSPEDKRFNPIPHYCKEEKPPEKPQKPIIQEVEKEIIVPDPEVLKENEALKRENASLKKDVCSLKRKSLAQTTKIVDLQKPKPVAKPIAKPVVKKVVKKKVVRKQV